MNMFLEITQNEESHFVEFKPSIVSEQGDNRTWELVPTTIDFPFKIVFTEVAYIFKEILRIDNLLIKYKPEIEAWIVDYLGKEYERENSGVDRSEEAESNEPTPYDSHKISIRNDRWSISHIFELIDKWNQVDLSPDFQRGFVWDYTRKARLIESLMLRIPVPAFYLSETNDGRYQVVDGLQRLTTIRDFLKNSFPLRFLEYLKEQENRYFTADGRKKGIDQIYWKNILQTQITVNIIEDRSPTKVKYDVFRRVNTGGNPLNNQEIRNCLSEKETRQLINELAFSKEFRNATGGSISTGRMQAQELVLRFISFWHDKIKNNDDWEYRGNMTEYLDDAINLLNKNKSAKHEEIKKAFYQAMKNALYLFGQYSFRKCLPEHLKQGIRQQLINKSLFTTWSVMLSELSSDAITSSNVNQGEFAVFLAERLKENQQYLDVVSFKTNDRAYVDLAFANADELINEYF